VDPGGVGAARPRAGLTPWASPMRESDRDVLRRRLDRRRAFLAHEEELHRAAFRVGPSLAASRRRGWRPPIAVGSRGARPLAAGTAALPAPGPVDTVRVAFLRVDFLSDRGGSASTGTGRFNLAPGDTFANPVDPPPHDRDFFRKHGEALARYYDVQSYGRVRIEVDVWPAGRDSAYHLTDMADFGPWRFGSSIFRAAVDLMRACFFAADSQSIAVGDRVPWDRYDRFVILHAGSDLQSDLDQDSRHDIPSFTMFVDDTDRVVFPDSSNRDRPIDRVAFLPETINQDDAYGALNGVNAHENGHNLFGMGDVYDIASALPVVGYWSLMDSGNLVGSLVADRDTVIFAVGLLPPSVDPFQRDFLLDQGLLQFRRPGAADTAEFRLLGSQRTNDFVKLDLSSDEYVILENRYLAPADSVRLLRDDTTGVVLGPREPDGFEYDALLPAGGILAWHVDESVIPFLTSLRTNPDFGFNSNPRRLGLQILEADGLDDLGDLGSPFLLGGEFDPWQASVAPVLSDTTIPSLVPNQGTRPHARVEFLDDASDTMRVRVTRRWQLPGWPVSANFPPGGPSLVAADLDDDGRPEVVWAGGDTSITDTSLAAREAVRDSAAIFAVRWDGRGIGGADTLDFAHLDRRPLREVAMLASGLTEGAVFAVTEYAGPGDALGGRLWALRPTGAPLPGFPVTLPSPATTPPLVTGTYDQGWQVLVGCADGSVRAVDPNGAVVATSPPVGSGAVSGRLALWSPQSSLPPVAWTGRLAAGDDAGALRVFQFPSLASVPGWSASAGGSGFAPSLLWLRLGGAGPNAAEECGAAGTPTLVAQDRDRLWAYCADSPALLSGWGASFGDTLVPGLAAGDPDGDGFPEVIVQGRRSQLAFINRTGRPSPGWPRRGTTEGFATHSPPLALDLSGDGRPEVVALNASGVIAALDGGGGTPSGWPLATGAGAEGTLLAADLDADGSLEVVAPDRFGRLYGYAVSASVLEAASPWRMPGGDPGRHAALTGGATSSPGAPGAGPLVVGSLKAYPNPARRKPIQFAYQLSEDATVEFRVLDSSGHEVARWTRAGRRADNLETWDPSAVPAGLYVAHVRFSGPRGSHGASLPLGILR
jgi:M6 family metalloprotease-like protein